MVRSSSNCAQKRLVDVLHVVFLCRRPELFGHLQKMFHPWLAYVHISLNPREALVYLSQLSTPNIFVAVVGEERDSKLWEPVERYLRRNKYQLVRLEER